MDASEPHGTRGDADGTAGVVAMISAIALSLLAGTVGYFLVGFATMTDCTNAYSCTDDGCAPCAGASHWLSSGAVINACLAVVGGVLLWRGTRRRSRLRLVPLAIGLVLACGASLLITSRAADGSYCRLGSAGYAASYCDE